MSLEAVIESNTAAIHALIAALQATGTVSAATTERREPAPGVAKLEAARAELTAKQAAAPKKQTAPATQSDAAAGDAPTPESKRSGEPSPSTPTSSSDAPQPGELKPWHEKTAPLYAELKDKPASLETCKKAILGISANVGREQAVVLLQRFGCEVVSEKPGKKHLDPSLYDDYMALALKILAGTADATEAQFNAE